MAGVIANVTGRVPKAVLFVRNYNASFFQMLLADEAEEAVNQAILETDVMLEETEKALMKEPIAGPLAAQIARIAAMKTLQVAADIAGLCSVEVQYNPSSIYLDTSAGSREIDTTSAGNIGNNQLTQIDVGTLTTFGVQLIFDDMNQWDAFGMDASMLSTGGFVSMMSEAVHLKHYSVRKQCEGLVACLLSPVTRKVMFCWSDMIFRGELNQVGVNYTMFNKSGEPIRATVDIMIQQNAETYKQEKGGYWDKAFTKAFEKKEGDIAGAASLASKLTNNALLNINI